MPKDPIEVKQRIIVNFFTAKRLLAALQLSVQRHEAVFGVLETDIQKRLRPQVAAQMQQQQQQLPRSRTRRRRVEVQDGCAREAGAAVASFDTLLQRAVPARRVQPSFVPEEQRPDDTAD